MTAPKPATGLLPVEWDADGKGGRYRFYLRPIGFLLGGKEGSRVTVPCPKCGRSAWKKSENLFVHEAAITLVRNEPVWDFTDDNACKWTKHDIADAAKKGGK